MMVEYPKLIHPVTCGKYKNKNGQHYVCISGEAPDGTTAIMRRLSDGWQLVAHNVRQYEDGTIEWDYSTGGHWTNSEKAEAAAKFYIKIKGGA